KRISLRDSRNGQDANRNANKERIHNHAPSCLGQNYALLVIVNHFLARVHKFHRAGCGCYPGVTLYVDAPIGNSLAGSEATLLCTNCEKDLARQRVKIGVAIADCLRMSPDCAISRFQPKHRLAPPWRGASGYDSV